MVEIYGNESNKEIIMESKLTEKESLKLITDMITLAKGNAKQSFFHIILWGWVIISICLVQFYIIQFTSFNNPHIVWLITIPFMLVSMVYGYREGKKEKSTSFIDSIYAWIWFAFIISLILIIFISIQLHNFNAITSHILIIAGIATFLSGKLIRFAPLVWGGCAFWAWSLVAFTLQYEYVLLINAAAIFTGYIIPGYMLKNKLKKDAV